MRMSQKRFQVLIGGRQQGKLSKYKNEPVEVDGMRFDSIAEATYYQRLKIMLQAGELTHFLRQVPFDLPGGVKYRLDFLVFYTDGLIDHVDVKGAFTEVFRIKKRQVEALYPIKIRCLKLEGTRFTEVEK